MFRTITLQAPRGLQVKLMEILNPIKMTKKDIVEDKYWAEFEFIGTVSCPHAKLKNYKKGIYQSIKIIATS